MSNKALKVRKVIGNLGWCSFAVYLVASLCGQEKVATIAGAATTGCAIACNGMRAVDEIKQIVEA